MPSQARFGVPFAYDQKNQPTPLYGYYIASRTWLAQVLLEFVAQYQKAERDNRTVVTYDSGYWEASPNPSNTQAVAHDSFRALMPPSVPVRGKYRANPGG